VLPPADERINELTLLPNPEKGTTVIAPQANDDDAVAKLRAKVAAFAPVRFSVGLDKLAASEKDALKHILVAAGEMQKIYEQQVYAGNPALAAKLAADTSDLGKLRSAYWKIMRSPWDRLDHKPFAIDIERPKGAGFYPEDLTAKELDAYVAAHPEQKDALLGLFTVVKRDGDKLVAIPYSQAYKRSLEVAAAELRQAAKLTKNKSLAKFLESRAAAFLSDDYYQSDKDWMDLDAEIDVTIGPYEQYEDELRGQKTAFEAFISFADPAASQRLAKFKKLLPTMQDNLPNAKDWRGKRGFESPIRVVDALFTAGDARRGVMTIAFNLPNDERVRKEKGAKKVLMRNVIEAKFAKIMQPIGQRIIDESQQKYLSSEAFFNEVLFHELSHYADLRVMPMRRAMRGACRGAGGAEVFRDAA
jgi:hypothetical protein